MAHQPLECTVRVGGVGGIATTPPTRTVQAHCAPWCTVLLLLQPQQLKLLPNPPSEARTRCEVDKAKSTKRSRRSKAEPDECDWRRYSAFLKATILQGISRTGSVHA